MFAYHVVGLGENRGMNREPDAERDQVPVFATNSVPFPGTFQTRSSARPRFRRCGFPAATSIALAATANALQSTKFERES